MSWWQHAVYPLGLLIALGCLTLIDYKWRLAFWRHPRRAAMVMAVSLVYFILWDISGIGLDIFYDGNDTYRSGLMLGPAFPIEELLFLTLLSYNVLLAWAFKGRKR